METYKILIVEDEQVVAMDVEMQLAELDYQVTGIATTGLEAIQLVQETRPDLVLMDIQLHGSEDGISVAHKMQEEGPIPILFVTAYGNSELRARAEQTGYTGYLTKPYKSRELDAAIRLALDKVSTAAGKDLAK